MNKIMDEAPTLFPSSSEFGQGLTRSLSFQNKKCKSAYAPTVAYPIDPLECSSEAESERSAPPKTSSDLESEDIVESSNDRYDDYGILVERAKGKSWPPAVQTNPKKRGLEAMERRKKGNDKVDKKKKASPNVENETPKKAKAPKAETETPKKIKAPKAETGTPKKVTAPKDCCTYKY